MCVCVYVCVTAGKEIDIDIFMTHLLKTWVWNGWVSFFPVTTMIQILRDFKPILDLDSYAEHMPEKRINCRVKNWSRLICRIDLYASIYSVCFLLQLLFSKDGVFVHTTVARADEDALVAGRIFLWEKVIAFWFSYHLLFLLFVASKVIFVQKIFRYEIVISDGKMQFSHPKWLP